MMSEETLRLLRDPERREPLRIAGAELIRQLNEAIREKGVHNRADRPVTRPLEGGLVRESGDLLYPVFDDVPLLLVDEAISVASFSVPGASAPQ